MVRNNLLMGASEGTFYLLPHTLRALEKLHCLIDREMHGIGAQKIVMPSLATKKLWKKASTKRIFMGSGGVLE